MKKYLIVICLLFLFKSNTYSQIDTVGVDRDYLEDQLYLVFTYNTMLNTPLEFAEHGFSYGGSLGFIRDLPFNEERNIGMGIGLGYGYNTFNQNLVLKEEEVSITDFSVSDGSNSIKNVFMVSSIELPIEFRWRTSTLEKLKFWRIYGGVTFSYVTSFRSKFQTDGGQEVIKNIDELERFQYALVLAMGNGTWNLYGNYSLTSLFKKGTQLTSGEPLVPQTLKIGLMFYIL